MSETTRKVITAEPDAMNAVREWIETEAAKVPAEDVAEWAMHRAVAFIELMAFIGTRSQPKRVAFQSDEFGARVEVIVRERT